MVVDEERKEKMSGQGNWPGFLMSSDCLTRRKCILSGFPAKNDVNIVSLTRRVTDVYVGRCLTLLLGFWDARLVA